MTRRCSTRADAARRSGGRDVTGRGSVPTAAAVAGSAISNHAMMPVPDGREPHREATDSTTLRAAGVRCRSSAPVSTSSVGGRSTPWVTSTSARPSATERTRIRIGGRSAANVLATSSLVPRTASSMVPAGNPNRRSDAATNRRDAATLSGTVGNAVEISAKWGRLASAFIVSVGTRGPLRSTALCDGPRARPT